MTSLTFLQICFVLTGREPIVPESELLALMRPRASFFSSFLFELFQRLVIDDKKHMRNNNPCTEIEVTLALHLPKHTHTHTCTCTHKCTHRRSSNKGTIKNNQRETTTTTHIKKKKLSYKKKVTETSFLSITSNISVKELDKQVCEDN